MSHPLSSFTRTFLKEHPENRTHHLQSLNVDQRATVMDEWVEHDSFRLMDLLHDDFSQSFMFECERHMNGNSKKNVPSKRLTFFVKPNPDFTPGPDVAKDFRPRIEIGSKRGERQFQAIIGPTELPSDLALTALQTFGPSGKLGRVRGCVVEIERREYDEHRAELSRREREREEKDIEANHDSVTASASRRQGKGKAKR